MTAEQLRNSILQEAISGRLVPQDPNDEPAAVLLQRIREEKARLVKEGKLKKKDLVETPITEDEIPFEIPSSWAWCRIKQVFSMQAGKFISANEIVGSPSKEYCYPCYGGNSLRGYVKRFNTDGYYNLVGRQGALCGNVNIAQGKFYATEHAIVTDGFGITDVKWAYYFLTALNLNKYATATAQPGLAVSKIIETLVPLPPLAEQKRIVAKLEELLPIVEQYGKAQTELDQLNAALPARLRQSILQEAISGKLVPQDENDEPTSLFLERLQETKEGLVKHKILKKDALSFGVVREEDIPFEIPANWEWRYLGDLVYLVSGTSYKKDDVRNNGIRILRGGNIVNDKLVLADDDVFLSEEYRSGEKNIRPNDIVIVASTGSKKVIGKPALVKEPIADTQIGAFLRIVRPIDAAYVPYLWTLFRSEYYRGHIRDLVKGTNINNIKEEYLTYMPIPLPPLAEQARIVAKIEELFEQIDQIKK